MKQANKLKICANIRALRGKVIYGKMIIKKQIVETPDEYPNKYRNKRTDRYAEMASHIEATTRQPILLKTNTIRNINPIKPLLPYISAPSAR